MGLRRVAAQLQLQLQQQEQPFTPPQQQKQPAQRKCHQQRAHNEKQTEQQQQQQHQQLQTKRTNHLILQQQQTPNQNQQLHQQQSIIAQQHAHQCGQNEYSTIQQQQQQKQTQKHPPPREQQQKQHHLQQQQFHHRWRTWPARNVSNEIACSTATASTTTTKAKTIVSTTKLTAPTMMAITKTTTKSIGIFLKRFSWLWLVALICAAHATSATPAAIITKTATTTTLLPHALTAAAAAAAVVASTSAASVAIATNANAATTYEPLAPHQYPARVPLLALDEEPEMELGLGLEERQVDTHSEELEQLEGAERALNALNSNEQQLLAYYRRAQYKQQQQKQQQQHHHGQRAAPESAVVLQQLVDFDEIVPTAGVVSTLRVDKTSHGKRRVTKRSVTTRTAEAASTAATVPAATAAGSASETTAAPEEKCEPKVLDEIPSEPYYDFTDIAEDAARQFTEFLASKFPASSASSQQPISDQLREEVRRRANGIASYALNEDENLLAFAIAAPSIHTVVVKFRDNVTIPPQQVHNKAFLGSYWRELGNAWNSSEGSQDWGAPFRDCNLLKGRWLWPFRISFTEYKIKIVAAAFIAADEDVCNDGLEEIFGRRHGCDRNTTFCLLTENKPAATRDVYTCICRESFYLPNTTLQGFRGDIVELSEGFDNYSCIPCPGGCTSCDQHGVCMFGEPQEVVSMESLLKVSVGSVLGACILCCIVLSVIVFQQRKCKAIASGMWTVLETILLGIVLLYASVAVHFFAASTERCLLEPWLRELGFITCYGAIILKLYRHLVDFRTRKAHRWVLRDVDLLKYLGTMVFAVVCYMAAFTASAQDLLETAQLETLREMRTNTCLPLKWEFVTQTSEVLILCFGLHLSFASRNANTQFRERQFLVAALVLEFLVSGTFYMLRFFYLPEMSPGAILLALFVRSQLTNTIALGLIFVPKLWYQHKQVPLPMNLSIRLPVDAFKVNDPQRLGGGYAGLCLGDPDIGELTISEMSPEDIRAELKRLYTQLEILKNKTLRQDNPHISKRRGGRKAGHRRFSLQALSAKHRSNKHHQDIEITEAEPSRTPEDSVCSVEGPTDAEISGISHSMLSHSMVSHSMVSHSK